jgi:hypothetical protein
MHGQQFVFPNQQSVNQSFSQSGSFSSTKGRSDSLKLGKQDFDGLKLMKQIFMFFKNESN